MTALKIATPVEVTIRERSELDGETSIDRADDEREADFLAWFADQLDDGRWHVAVRP